MSIDPATAEALARRPEPVYGYVYCLVNDSMPGLVKVGMTMRDPSERLKEANRTTFVPTPFTIAFAKRVSDPAEKEQIIHKALAAHRINKRREFFSSTPADVRALFDLIIGDYWELPGGRTAAPAQAKPMVEAVAPIFSPYSTAEGEELFDDELAAPRRTPGCFWLFLQSLCPWGGCCPWDGMCDPKRPARKTFTCEFCHVTILRSSRKRHLGSRSHRQTILAIP